MNIKDNGTQKVAVGYFSQIVKHHTEAQAVVENSAHFQAVLAIEPGGFYVAATLGQHEHPPGIDPPEMHTGVHPLMRTFE